MGAILDDAFPYDRGEVLEQALLPFRPILGPLATSAIRDDIGEAFHYNGPFDPWLRILHEAPPSPVAMGTGVLSGAQVAMLGGTRPERTLRSITSRLYGDRIRAERKASDMLTHAGEALDSFVEHVTVEPAKGLDDAREKVRAFAELGIAVELAALAGRLHDLSPELMWPNEETEPSEHAEMWQRCFPGMIAVFRRITLSRKDDVVFRAYYVHEGSIEEIADARGVKPSTEAARRLGFVTRFAAAIKAEIAAVAGTTGVRVADDPALPGNASGAGGRPLLTATAPAARRRRR